MDVFILSHPYEIFSLLTIVGALFHWLQKAAKGEASFDPIQYWFKETPGYTYGTIGALVLAWWGTVSGDLLAGAKWQMIVTYGITTGITLNSIISVGGQNVTKPQA